MIRAGRIALTAVLLAGCSTVGPDYRAPEINAPSQFVSQDVLETLNQSRQDQPFAADWWKGFDDPVLNQLVANGLENNYDIAAAMARAGEAQARLKLAGAGDNLSAIADLGSDIEQRQALSGDQESTTTQGFFATLSAALPLDVFGRTRREVEAARAGLESAQAELNSFVLSTSSAIAGEYLRLRGNQRQLELLRESVELQEKTLAIVRSRFKAGLSPELDLQRAITSVENLRADIPPLEESLQNSRNRLAGLTGRFPGAYETLLSEQEDIPEYKSRIPDLVPLEVLNTRPDIRQAEAELKRAIAAIGVAEAAYYPAFQLSGQISISTTGISSAPATDVLIASLGALIEQIVTAGGAREANVEITEAQAEQALADYEQALRTASEDVETSLAAIRASLERQSSLEKAVQSSERSFFQAEGLYQQGLISFLDVVDAQRVLASAEQQLAAARTSYVTEIATLFRVLGVEIDHT